MSTSLKQVLKISTVIYVDNVEENSSKTLNILKLFFDKVIICNSSKEALENYNSNKINAIITEIELADNSGFNLIKTIREEDTNLPIVVISKNKEEKNLFQAIRLNLVDYLVKPVNANDLIFTLNNVAKKIFNNGNITVNITNNISYSFLDKTLESNNKKIPLTKNEIKLIELLISNKDKTVTKEDIEIHIWEDETVSDSAFKSLFLRLRNKIGKDSIVNNFGVGYSINLEK